MSEMRVLPLVRVDAKYSDACGKYPERIRIAMADGSTQWYRIEVQQPAPQVLKTIELIRAMNEVASGGYVARHEKGR